MTEVAERRAPEVVDASSVEGVEVIAHRFDTFSTVAMNYRRATLTTFVTECSVGGQANVHGATTVNIAASSVGGGYTITVRQENGQHFTLNVFSDEPTLPITITPAIR